MPDQSKIDEAAARLLRLNPAEYEVGAIVGVSIEDIRAVLDELERLQAFERQFPSHKLMPSLNLKPEQP
jgi:Tfp pilus assembly protein PilO